MLKTDLESAGQAGTASGGKTSRRVRIGFLLGAIGPAAGLQIVTILMLRFLTDSLAMTAATAGLLLAIVKIYDGLIDPAIGVASDRTSGKWGRRRPWMLGGAVILPVSVAALFSVPMFASSYPVAIVLVLLLIHGTAYSMFVVPYTAIGSEVCDDYHERSVLMSYRVYGGALGLLVAATGAPWLLALWGPTAEGHAMMGVTIGVIIAVVGLAAAMILPASGAPAAQRTVLSARKRLALAWQNRPFRLILLSHVSFQIAVAATVSSTAFFSRHVLLLSDLWLGSFYGLKVVGNIISMPMWLWIAKRFDKRNAYIAALAAYGLFNLSWLFATPEDWIGLVLIRMFIIGVAMGGVILLGYSVVTDIMRYDNVQTGLRREGAFAGAISLIDKISAAVGVALIGYFLTASGYVSSASGHGSRQSAEALTAIYIAFAAVPGIASLISMATIFGYSLKERDLRGEQSGPA
ncbi:MFS transporter [Sphingomonas soli]|uniref:MFS transporter n=1 Tax=Sphingomonas soli TaxID=266127 RepID=UPI00147041FF|nr:MFS transporter [Sphingomonas soli]